MVTVAEAKLPADEFALAHTLSTLPDLDIEVEGTVRSGENRVLPLLWVRGVDSEAFEAACEADESSRDVTLIEAFDGEYLYQMTWIQKVELVLRMLTNGEATILDAYGHDTVWHFRLLCPSREKLSEIKACCADRDLTFDIESIREMDGERAGKHALTNGQYDALVAATEAGYFEIPRETSLEELADDLDVSHQALSERIRRGTEALVEDALQTGPSQQHTRASPAD